MNGLALFLVSSILIGLGATLTLDLWSFFLKYAFRITPSDFCLLGRWIQYMPYRTFTHSNIAAAQPKSVECEVGWIAHYIIGIIFAVIFIAFAGDGWLQHPTVIPAITFGVLTVAAPLFIMHPAFGLGFAASRMSNPVQARLSRLMNHNAFCVGLYLLGLLLDCLT